MAKVKVGGGGSVGLAEFTQRFKAGEVIFKQGDPGCEMFIIQTGQVAISRRAGDVEERLAVLEKGDFFGEMALLEGYPERSATARALADVVVLRLRRLDLQSLLQRKPSVAVRMMAKLSERLRESNRRLQELADRANTPALPPVPASQGIEAWAVLVHEPSGRIFPLRPVADTSIGRHDPVTGVTPDVDLSALDAERTVSRQHAVIRATGDALTLAEINVKSNGTFLNGNRIEALRHYPLRHDDTIQFALVPFRLHIVRR